MFIKNILSLDLIFTIKNILSKKLVNILKDQQLDFQNSILPKRLIIYGILI